MKLLLDAMVSPVVARQLRLHGHDVDAIVERKTQRTASDRSILRIAVSEGRAVVTRDAKDFRRILAEMGITSYPGLVLIPRSIRMSHRGNIGPLVRALDALLTANPELRNREHWLS